MIPGIPASFRCSTFERLFKTQAEAYRRATGKSVATDEDKALAAWFWRNTHYYHGEEGLRDCFPQKFGGDKSRDYWTGLFADGIGPLRHHPCPTVCRNGRPVRACRSAW